VSDEPVGGRDYPRNQEEFKRFFSTERACVLFLARLRWPEGFECPPCGHDRYWLRGDGLFLCCECRRKTSPKAGTVLDKTRLPLSKWLQAIWYVTEETGGVSALSLQRALGLGSYETAWAMLHKLRRAMEPTSGKLEGTVEVDESFVGGNEPGVRGRLSKTKAKSDHRHREARARLWACPAAADRRLSRGHPLRLRRRSC
jgi:transposase-like protein